MRKRVASRFPILRSKQQGEKRGGGIFEHGAISLKKKHSRGAVGKMREVLSSPLSDQPRLEVGRHVPRLSRHLTAGTCFSSSSLSNSDLQVSMHIH